MVLLMDVGPLVLKESHVSTYADDSTVYTSTPTVHDFNLDLNRKLNSVMEWISSNKLVLNASKTNRNSPKPNLDLHINDVLLNLVQEAELLGLTLDS